MDSIRSTPLAAPFSTQINGLKIVVDTRDGPTTARAVRIGAASA